MVQAFVTTQRLRFCDTDALGHVNNAVYAVMYEAGRAEMMALAGLMDPGSAFGVVIARLELDFLREMTWPNEIRIETWVLRMSAKALHVRQQLLMDGQVVSRAASVLAIIDVGTRRAVPITEEWRGIFGRWLMPETASAE